VRQGLLGHPRILSSPLPTSPITRTDAGADRNSPLNLARAERLN
jgi:hypothetical protein